MSDVIHLRHVHPRSLHERLGPQKPGSGFVARRYGAVRQGNVEAPVQDVGGDGLRKGTDRDVRERGRLRSRNGSLFRNRRKILKILAGGR